MFVDTEVIGVDQLLTNIPELQHISQIYSVR